MKQFCLALLFASISVSTNAGEAPTKFLFAYGAIGGNAVPLWIAKEQGIFRKYNLEPQLIYIIAGRAMQSMLAGDIQFGLLGATHVANAVSAGGDMTMLLGMEDRLNYFLNARPGIRSAEDLKGKKVGIGTPSGSLALATYVGLDHLGLVPRRDRITLLNTGSTPERINALFTGAIDAAFFQSGGRTDRSAAGFSDPLRSGQSERAVSIIRLGNLTQVYSLQSTAGRKPCQGGDRGGRVRAKSHQQKNRRRQHRTEPAA